MRMKIKLEAAYHEAGHIVAAKRSIFHDVVGGVDLEAYGAGGTHISLSKTKLRNAGKIQSPSSQHDKDVAKDLAVVLTAGFAAEQIAAQKNLALTPNRQCADPDYDFLDDVLQNAGLSRKTDRAELAAHTLLTQEWEKVERIAALAFEKGGLSSAQLDELINEILL
ncbi:hypothetical protein DS906_13915 [Ruegeria sp. A3M17]|nr:hypothetical protein DS906_13915 [Ruegeria sp. A3M17]